MRIGSLPRLMLLGWKAHHTKIGGWGQKWGQNVFGGKITSIVFNQTHPVIKTIH